LFKGLFNIIVKEVKELIRDPKILLGMLLVPALMFPIMGFAVQTAMETAEESMRSISIALMDFDKGPVAENLTNFLITLNVTIVEVDNLSFTEAVDYDDKCSVEGIRRRPGCSKSS